MGLYMQHLKSLRSPNTAEHHAVRIGPWIAMYRASEARQAAAHITQDLMARYKPATINRSLGTLRKALRLAWDRGLVATDYSAAVRSLPENNQMADYLTLAEVQKIADCASEAVRAAIWIALLTGCRRGEVCAIKAEDIGPDRIRIQAGNTKTLRHRDVPIVPALRPWLRFLPLSINFEGVKSGWRRARVAAGLPRARYHALRHSCATILLAPPINAPLHLVRDILGHSSIHSTERYAHVMVQPQREALERLGGLAAASNGSSK
jgi:integrase